MARLLGVSLSGYSQWRQQQPSRRSQQKQALQQAIARVCARFDGSAGSPLITAELREQTEFAQLSRTRVAQEMQTLGLRCRLRMAKKPRTTQSDPTHRVVGNQYEEWCLNTLRFTMPGSVSIRAMVGRHQNSMKMNLRNNSAEPLNYESIFSGQGWYDRNRGGL